jgi:hypothetical protein
VENSIKFVRFLKFGMGNAGKGKIRKLLKTKGKLTLDLPAPAMVNLD